MHPRLTLITGNRPQEMPPSDGWRAVAQMLARRLVWPLEHLHGTAKVSRPAPHNTVELVDWEDDFCAALSMCGVGIDRQRLDQIRSGVALEVVCTSCGSRPRRTASSGVWHCDCTPMDNSPRWQGARLISSEAPIHPVTEAPPEQPMPPTAQPNGSEASAQ